MDTNTFKVKNLEQKKEKSSIFIGSSTESLPVAKAIKTLLLEQGAGKYEVDIWDEDIFDPTIQQGKSAYGIGGKSFDKGKPTNTDGNQNQAGNTPTNLDSLRNFSDIYDFAIFVFVPDDKLISQTRKHLETEKTLEGAGTRHNLVFEFGLFLGRIGPKKTFIVADENIRQFINDFFTDLRDISLYSYKSTYQDWLKAGMPAGVDTWDADSLAQQVQAIQSAIETTELNIELGFLPSTALGIGYFENLLKLVHTALNDIRKAADPKPKITIETPTADGKVKTDIDLGTRKVKLKVVMPGVLIGASHDEYKQQIINMGLVTAIVPFRTRPLTLFCHPKVLEPGGDLVIYDIPSTLFSSSKAIDMLTEVRDIRQLLDEKEKRNFRKTVEYLIRQPQTDEALSGISDVVEVVDVADVLGDFATLERE